MSKEFKEVNPSEMVNIFKTGARSLDKLWAEIFQEVIISEKNNTYTVEGEEMEDETRILLAFSSVFMKDEKIVSHLLVEKASYDVYSFTTDKIVDKFESVINKLWTPFEGLGLKEATNGYLKILKSEERKVIGSLNLTVGQKSKIESVRLVTPALGENYDSLSYFEAIHNLRSHPLGHGQDLNIAVPQRDN